MRTVSNEGASCDRKSTIGRLERGAPQYSFRQGSGGLGTPLYGGCDRRTRRVGAKNGFPREAIHTRRPCSQSEGRAENVNLLGRIGPSRQGIEIRSKVVTFFLPRLRKLWQYVIAFRSLCVKRNARQRPAENRPKGRAPVLRRWLFRFRGTHRFCVTSNGNANGGYEGDTDVQEVLCSIT